MATQDQIQALEREISEYYKQLDQLEKQYNVRIRQERQRIEASYQEAFDRLEKDYRDLFNRLDQTYTQAHLAEVDRMQGQYQALKEKTEQKEREMEEMLVELEKEQRAFFNQRNLQQALEKKLAFQRISEFQSRLEKICRLPVEQFYPRALSKYIDSGNQAQNLLEQGLYTLALARMDTILMSLDRLENDTLNKLEELAELFGLYEQKLRYIDDFLEHDESRSLSENGKTVLRLSLTDLDYWSDSLYSDLQKQLADHRSRLSQGVDGYLHELDSSSINAALHLDRLIQRLDEIPKKLGVCISYALSACDCYNYTVTFKNLADSILKGQNFTPEPLKLGAVKIGNDQSQGYKYYHDHYLQTIECIDPSSTPDFREERVLSYKNQIGGREMRCEFFLVPQRHEQSVSVQPFFKLSSPSIEPIMIQTLSRLFAKNGIPLIYADNELVCTTCSDRPLNLKIIDQMLSLTRADSLDEIRAKYSLA